MNTTGIVALVAIALVAVASAVIGSLGHRVARSTSDFLVASRTVGPVANASAISGEYLSAASFLGVAGLILLDGADALWFPVGVHHRLPGARALFVAAPLRRSGAYTVPDFAVARLNSDGLRRMCTVFVLVIGWLYLLPQLQGAGLALTTLTALPAWSGIAGAGLVVVLDRGRRRHAVDHVRAGVPVLAQADGAAGAGGVRARPVPVRQPAALTATPPDFRAGRPSTSVPTPSCRPAETVTLVVDGTVDRVPSTGR